MAIWENVKSAFAALFDKSYGEQVMAHVYGGSGSGIWSSNAWGGSWGRQELANHYTGFNYLAIQPLMKEIGGMMPHAAYRRDGTVIKESRNKAIQSGDWAEFHRINSRYLNPLERSKAVAPIQVHEELEPVKAEHDLIRLLRNPNGPDTSSTFFRKLIMYWRLYGEFFIWLVPPRSERLSGIKQPPVEMWVIPSHWVWPKHDPEHKAIFKEFEIRPYASYQPADVSGGIGLGWYPGGTGKHVIPADQMVYYCEPNPYGYLNGYSPLSAISHWIDCSDSIDRSRTAQFQNGAFPGVCVEFDKSVVEPDKGMIDRLEARIVTTYAGVRRTGKPIILSPGVTMKPLDNKPYEMAYVESAEQIKDWVFAAQGTGQSIVGLVEQTTFNNVWGARANFYSNTIKPACNLLGEIFTEKIARLFDKDLVVYWPDTAPVDPDVEMKKWEMLLRNNVTVPNIVAQAYGLPPTEWGDKPLDQLKTMWAAPPQPGAPQGQAANPMAQQITPHQEPEPKHNTLNQSPLHDRGAGKPDDGEAKNDLIQHRLKPSLNGFDKKAALLTHRLH